MITSTFSAQNIDYRVEFSKWFQLEFKTVKFPSSGTVFDYCIEKENLRFTPWSEKIPKFELDPDTPLQVGSEGPHHVNLWFRSAGMTCKNFKMYCR